MLRKHLFLLLILFTVTVHAAEEPSLDEVMEGFEDSTATKNGDDIDAVLKGFDEAATVKQDELEEVLSGFEEEKPVTVNGGNQTEEKNWQLAGDITVSSSYNYAHQAAEPGKTDWHGLSRLRTTLGLELGGQINDQWKAHIDGYAFYDLAYTINGRDNYTEEVLDTYESEVEPGEAYVHGNLSSTIDLKLGRQIVVWGKSDNLRVTDVLNPLDRREPGMVDIEDLRLPVAMAKLDYYVGDWGLSAIAIPEVRFSKTPPYGSDFYPFAEPPLPEVIPEESFDNTQYALAANGIFSGWDLSFYAADIYNDTPHIYLSNGKPLQGHSRINMIGVASNIALGNWLLKGEAAGFNSIEFSNLPGIKKDRSDILLGVEYSGFHDTTLSLETVRRHIHDMDTALMTQGYIEDEWQTALRYQAEFLHARLELIALVTLYGKSLDEGGFGRFSAAYDLRDALTVTGGIVVYEEGDRPPLVGIGDNDRVFAEIKYSF